jgi:hypothetical protein
MTMMYTLFSYSERGQSDSMHAFQARKGSSVKEYDKGTDLQILGMNCFQINCNTIHCKDLRQVHTWTRHHG